MDTKEEMVKFRYNLNRFNTSMTAYEEAFGSANSFRARKRTDELNGMPSKKWDNFIEEKDKLATRHLNEAEEAYVLLKALICPGKVKKKS